MVVQTNDRKKDRPTNRATHQPNENLQNLKAFYRMLEVLD